MDQTFDVVVLGTVLLFLSPCSKKNKGTETKGTSPNKPKQTGPEAEGKLLPGLFGQGIMD